MLQQKNILVVDDVALIRKNMEETLIQLGAKQIYLAEDAETAIATVEDKHVDMVFMDINLGDESGLDVLKLLLEKDKSIYPVMLSGESSIDNVKASLKMGVKDFIVKPYNQDKIEEVVGKYLKTH